MINTSVRHKTQESRLFQKSKIIPWQQLWQNFVCGCGCGNTWFKSVQLIWIQTHDLPSIFVPSCSRWNDTSWCEKNETVWKIFRFGNQRFYLIPVCLEISINTVFVVGFSSFVASVPKKFRESKQPFSNLLSIKRMKIPRCLCLTIFWKKDK